MHAFAGIVAFGRPLDTIDSPERLARALTRTRKGQLQTVRGEDVIMVARRGTSADFPPRSGVQSRSLFVADARLDNRPELIGALNLAPEDADRLSGDQIIARLFARFGDSGLARVVGGFAFAHFDATTGCLTLARDCLGNRSLFYHRGDGFVAFATSLSTLLALACVPRVIDDLAVADFLVINKNEPRRTLYRGIERVPTRTIVALDRERTMHRIYWAPDLEARLPPMRREGIITRARELFDEAVAAAIADTPDVAISLSGGFDSSAVAATVARLGRSDSITGYSLVAPADYDVRFKAHKYVDERDKLEALVAMHPTIRLKTFAPELPHPGSSGDRLFARIGMPSYGPTNTGFFEYIDAAVSEAGYDALLIGTSGNFGLTWSGRFWLTELARTGQWRRLIAAIRAHGRQSATGDSAIRIFMRHVALQFASPRQRDWIDRWLGREEASVTRFSSINPELIDDLDLKKRWADQGFDPGFRGLGASPVAFRARRLFDYNQEGRDFNCANADMNGFEYRDPHNDRRLLEFALAVPEGMYHEGAERSFARQVFADRLPAAILTETRRGEQGVGWFRHLHARRAEFAQEIERIAASPLASRMIDVNRLKTLLDDWPKDEQAAVDRSDEYRSLLARGVHVGHFLRWVEGSNA